MYLDQLIELLDEQNDSSDVIVRRIDEHGEVVGQGIVQALDSWRGSYADTSLDTVGRDYVLGTTYRTVRELVSYLRSRIGQTMTGYKGGDYEISEHRAVFADPWGDCSGWSPVSVKDDDGVVLVDCYQISLYW